MNLKYKKRQYHALITTEKKLSFFHLQVSVLAQLNHPNIVAYRESFEGITYYYHKNCMASQCCLIRQNLSCAL